MRKVRLNQFVHAVRSERVKTKWHEMAAMFLQYFPCSFQIYAPDTFSNKSAILYAADRNVEP